VSSQCARLTTDMWLGRMCTQAMHFESRGCRQNLDCPPAQSPALELCPYWGHPGSGRAECAGVTWCIEPEEPRAAGVGGPAVAAARWRGACCVQLFCRLSSRCPTALVLVCFSKCWQVTAHHPCSHLRWFTYYLASQWLAHQLGDCWQPASSWLLFLCCAAPVGGAFPAAAA
jgi:hypothetical protein